MSAVFEQPSFWQRIKPILFGFDALLITAVIILAAFGLMTM